MEGRDRGPGLALLEAVVAEAIERPLPQLTRRTVPLPRVRGKADAVIGMRRSGKTWRLFQEMQDLLAAGVPRENLLYLNLEDERLLPLAARDLDRILDVLRRRYPHARTRETWLFLDEIQNVDGWEAFVRRVMDSDPVRFVLSGSSARLLAREIATGLRGRSLPTEILPFSFREALAHEGHAPPTKWPPAASFRSLLENRFRSYLDRGGFPEVQSLPDDVGLRVLRDYVDVAILRDVVERHGIANVAAIRWLVRHLVRNPAGLFSINRFYQDVRSQGLAIGKDTLHEYLAHLEDAFLLFTVAVDARSERRRMVNPRKIYLVDHGLPRAFAFEDVADVGHRLENAVYLELRRRGAEVAYVVTRDGGEVDFIARRHGGPSELLQSCADLSAAETRAREVDGLRSAMCEYRKRSATIVTLVDAEEISVPEGRIEVVPAWRWMLETAE